MLLKTHDCNRFSFCGSSAAKNQFIYFFLFFYLKISYNNICAHFFSFEENRKIIIYFYVLFAFIWFYSTPNNLPICTFCLNNFLVFHFNFLLFSIIIIRYRPKKFDVCTCCVAFAVFVNCLFHVYARVEYLYKR